ncbi:hypothetical protein FACUT_14110 [Fusarium acutatum]|uniref:Uncharacterized protein n=1 Tax=Fusarium acutatum TaxID=78861 RepID=A0A8H4N814_9HYPO|nr:hypothetical protein FACUT_14110 [Fusarium acutatum]
MKTVILEGTPSTSFNKNSKTEPLRPPVPETLPVGHQEVMGRDKTLSHGQRYDLDREEGLRVKKQREYAAIEDAGMSKPFKHAAIALKYNLDLREGIFGVSSTGSDGDDEALSEGVSFGPESQMNPASLRARSWVSSKQLSSFGWCSGLRRQQCWIHPTLRTKWTSFWKHYCEANDFPYLPKYAEYGRAANVRRNINKKFGFTSSSPPLEISTPTPRT